jgi:hypothetical protein
MGFIETILFESWTTASIPRSIFKMKLFNIFCNFFQFLLAHGFLYLFWVFYTKELEKFVNI